MIKTNKILLPVFIIIATIVVLTVIKSRNTKVNSESNKNKSLTQENDGGNVKIIVTPKTSSVGEKPSFDIVFETHSVDLSFDVAKQSILVDDKGNDFGQPVWDGSPPGGHHRSGTLTFDSSLAQTNNVELIIKNVAGIPERKFRWKL